MGLFSIDTPIDVKNYNLKTALFSIQVQKAVVDPENENNIKISVLVTNNSSEVLDAYMIGFELFTVFHEYTGHCGGYSLGDIKPGKSISATWSFLIFEPGLVGTVIAYPYKSRLKSGQVWICDTSVIEEKIREIFQKEVNIVAEEEKRRRLK